MREPSKSVAGQQGVDVARLCRHFSELSPQPMIAVEGTTHIVRYLNDAFAQLVGKERGELIGRPFAEAVPEGEANGCLALLDRVYRTGTPEILEEQQHDQIHNQEHNQTSPVYWSYSVWAMLGVDEHPVGVLIQVTDATEVALFRRQAVEMNEQLLISATRQHELTEEVVEANELLEQRVQERTQALAETNAQLHNEIAKRRQLLQRLITSQEDERKRIARELHDQLSQDLIAVKLTLGLLAKSFSSAESCDESCAGSGHSTDEVIKSLEERVTGLIDQVHHMAWQLRDPILDSLGLLAAIKEYASHWSRKNGVTAEVSIHTEFPLHLTPEVESTLYRVAQEALINVSRHAQASLVSITILAKTTTVEGQKVVVLLVSDNGRGFDTKQTTSRLGIRGMGERMYLIGGTLEVESAMGEGTSVLANCPLNQ